MRTIIFGTGGIYNLRKKDMRLLDPGIDVVAFLDNDPEKTEHEGILVYRPEKIKELKYDQILLMSKKSEEMREQLLSLDVPAGAIYDWDQFCANHRKNAFQVFAADDELGKGEKVLVLTTEMNYNGGTLAASYAAMALKDKGYTVVLAAERGDLRFIHEMRDSGINVVLCPGLITLGKNEFLFIKQFDHIIINVFQMVRFAVEVSKKMPVMWWIHEPPHIIERTIKQNPGNTKEEFFHKMSIYAVSSVAQTNFNSFYPGVIKKILPYGIPDICPTMEKLDIEHEVTFALVGSTSEGKGVDIYLEACDILDQNKEACTCLLVGQMEGASQFDRNIRHRATELKNIQMTGSFIRDEIKKLYERISVLVCPSRMDSLPIVCTEAMMFGKPVIVSDHTGTAAFVKDGWNGFVCETENVEDLASKMKWCIDNRDKLAEMGNNARKTYEQYFTMESFGDRLEKALMETENAFAGSKE